MTIGMDVTALGQAAGAAEETPRSLGEQVEYLFAQQLLQALSEHEKQREGQEGAGYLGLLSGPLAHELARSGGLGIAGQLVPEETKP
jgi:Rod binding domain-containing protein